MDETGYINRTVLAGLHNIHVNDYIIFVMVFLFTRFLISRSYAQSSVHNYPPAPSPPGLPILGNLLDFQDDMRDVFSKWTKQVGGVFRLRIGPLMDILVIGDIESIREAFVEKGDIFSHRTIPPLINIALGQRGSFLWEAGDRWKKTRKFGQTALRNFGLGKKSMEDRVIDEGKSLILACEKKAGESFNPKVLITNAVGNIISWLVFGFRYEYGDPVFAKLVNDFTMFTDNLSMTSAGGVFPYLYYTPLYKSMRRPVRDIISYIKSVVVDHRQTSDPLNVRDIIDLYMKEIKEQRDGNVEDAIDESLEWRLIFDLFAAGMATSSETLLWAILIVAQHPQIMSEIHEEIDSFIGSERSPTMADQTNVPLTVATLMEVNRIRPVAPLGLPRFTSTDTTVKGYHVPKDTVVLMNIWEVLNSPKYWTKPEEFNPYRFLSVDHRRVIDHPAFIPFGIGLRVCLGEKLARMQLFIFFTSLLQRFTLRLADDSISVGMKGKAGMTYPPLDYKIILETRGNDDL